MAFTLTISTAAKPTPIRGAKMPSRKRTPGDFFVTLKTATPGLRMQGLGARYFSPTLHTWISRDPWGIQTAIQTGMEAVRFEGLRYRPQTVGRKTLTGSGPDLFLSQTEHPFSFVGNDPVDSVDPHGLVRWNISGRILHQQIAPWKDELPSVRGVDIEASTTLGRSIVVWEAYKVYQDRFTYWCHGFTFDGVGAGPRSPYSGWSTQRILDDEYEKICCGLAQPGDIVAFFGPPEPPNHSGKISKVVVSNNRFDADASKDMSKRGYQTVGTYTFTDEAVQYLAPYRCYQKRESPKRTGCCPEKGKYEL